MDQIAYLQQSLDNITNKLEEREKLVSEQTVEIKRAKDEKLSSELKVKKLMNSIKECEQLQLVLTARLQEAETQNQKLDLDYDCLEDTLAQIPLLATKIGEDFIAFSSEHIEKCSNLNNQAVGEEFWIGQCEEIAKDIERLKAQRRERERYALQARKSEETRLEHQVNEEELNLAYINKCVESMKTKNAELRQLREARKAIGSPAYSQASNTNGNGRDATTHMSYSRGGASKGTASATAYTTATNTRTPPSEDPEEYWPIPQQGPAMMTSAVQQTTTTTVSQVVSPQPSFFEPPPTVVTTTTTTTKMTTSATTATAAAPAAPAAPHPPSASGDQSPLPSFTSSEMNDLLYEQTSFEGSYYGGDGTGSAAITPWYQQHKRKRSATANGGSSGLGGEAVRQGQTASTHRVSPCNELQQQQWKI